jgi:outer membrane protein OmpA-like peptidoglycan-associated protein
MSQRFARALSTLVGALAPVIAIAQTSTLRAELEPYGVAPNGANIERVVLRVEEEPTGRLVPLLPYIFFDEGSAEIPARYLSTDSAWTSDPFVRRYRSILAIVAERMRSSPGERLTLTGTTSTGASERRHPGLARARAEAVASALATRYGIDRSRLAVLERGLPELPSNNARPEGRAENRRVELTGSSLLLGPIEVDDTLARRSSPGMRLVPSVIAPAGLMDWRIELAHDGKVFRRLSGHGAIGEVFAETFTDAELRRFAERPDGIDVALSVRDSTGDTVMTPRRTILFQLERARRPLAAGEGRAQDRETIVLFDFDRADLHQDSREILLDLLARIPTVARLGLTGFTDEVGDEKRNLALSQQRAQTVAAALPGRIAHAGGAGESGGLHWNTTPEDRFYSRVVRVIVEGW